MLRHFLLGVLATLVVGAAIAALVIVTGVFDVAARPSPLDPVLSYASTRSIAHHATDEKNPLAGDLAARKVGLAHYRDLCLACHGGPGAEPREFAAGLHPPPPDLASRESQAFTDGMLYEIVKGGIGSTGMPAFGRTHKPDQIWSIVAFLRHLPSLSPEEKAELARGEEHEGEPGAAQPPAPAPRAGQVAGASAAGAVPGASVHAIAISNFKYAPETVTVKAGDVVEWKNTDFVPHTATADDGTFDTGRIDAGATKRIVVTKKGRFPYFCRYHQGMKGTLVVQ